MADLLALLCVMFSCVFVILPYFVPVQVWYLIVLIPDLCFLLYFAYMLYELNILNLRMHGFFKFKVKTLIRS